MPKEPNKNFSCVFSLNTPFPLFILFFQSPVKVNLPQVTYGLPVNYIMETLGSLLGLTGPAYALPAIWTIQVFSMESSKPANCTGTDVTFGVLVTEWVLMLIAIFVTAYATHQRISGWYSVPFGILYMVGAGLLGASEMVTWDSSDSAESLHKQEVPGPDKCKGSNAASLLRLIGFGLIFFLSYVLWGFSLYTNKKKEKKTKSPYGEL